MVAVRVEMEGSVWEDVVAVGVWGPVDVDSHGRWVRVASMSIEAGREAKGATGGGREVKGHSGWDRTEVDWETVAWAISCSTNGPARSV